MTLVADVQVASPSEDPLIEFRMPSLGADMQAGTVVEWRLKPGEPIKRGDVIAVVETDKGAIDVDIFTSGQLERILVPVGEKVPVGTPLALVRAEPGASRPIPVVSPAAPAPPRVIEQTPAEVSSHAPSGRVRASPLARKLAADLGIDLAAVVGTGPGGAIDRADVERAAQAARVAATQPTLVVRPTSVAPQVAPASAATRQAAMRRAIAAAMARSNREIPHYYLETSIDMQHALAWLQEENIRRPVTERLLPAVVLLKAVALATHEVPEVNGFWIDDQFQPADAIHLGVAVSLRTGGLVTPAIHDTDLKTLDELSGGLRDVVLRARSGGLRSSELSDATLTVTNLGDLGVDKVFGVIYPPQVALVGFGAIMSRPWAVDGLLGVRPIVTATLAGDHRASDGHRGSRFLAAVNHLLQQPEAL
jgi:pyruvate dehydrogenase E2 component (dihydrolipoamide acetyltransferase)